jgi:serine/threonine-protein kinase
MVERSPFDSLMGATLGNYRLEELLEKHESSSIYKARNTSSGALFRLRVIAVPTDLKPEDRIVYLGRFQQEANQVAVLHHRFILPLVDYGMHSATGDTGGISWPYLITPYFSMKPLSSLISQKGPFDVSLTGRYLDQIASALEYAHQYAILHRNLSTSCIFINQDSNLLVSDFGVLQMLQEGNRFNRSNNIQSGVYGMNESSAPAPEQILGQAVDTYTDVYALGAMLYRILTGHRAYRAKTFQELMQLHLQAPIPSLTVWRKDLPKALDGIIARAMAKEPASRYLHPGDVANAYHQIIAPHDTQRAPIIIATSAIASSEHSKGTYTATGAQAMGGNTQSAPVSRRRMLGFIVAGGGVIVAVVAVGVLGKNYLGGNAASTSTSSTNSVPGNTPVANQTGSTTHGNVLAHTSDIPSNSAKTFPIAGQENPGVIVHLTDGRFVAFDSTCTHAGCAVLYSQQDKLLECPCHSAEFDPAKNAAVVQGPATTPLAPIKITVNADGTITKG